MDVNTQKALFDAVEKQLIAQDVRTGRQPGDPNIQLGDTLQALIPANDKGQPVLMELMLSPIDDDAVLLQLYTTLFTDVGPGRGELEKALDALNFQSVMGAFGFFQDQFYHRYTIPLFNEPVVVQASRIMYVIGCVCDQLSIFYDGIADISCGNSTAEEFFRRLRDGQA